MASNVKLKGSMVELKTFEKYKNKDMLWNKVEEIDLKKMVTFVWCKLNAKHKAVILANPLYKGSAKTAVEAYIKGTYFVKKCTIDRHFEGILIFQLFA